MIYVVEAGDSVDSIALRFNVTVEAIAYANQIPYPYSLTVGEAIYIEESGVADRNRRFIYVNGYAYPFISRWVLNETLPYLTELSVFSYGFTNEGDLVYPELDDVWMIEAAKNYSVRPILTLTPFDELGNFNNNLISSVVNNEIYRNNLINQVEYQLRTKGFAGVDIDFEYILAEDRDAFTAFVNAMTKRLNEVGYVVSVALAPKVSDSQPGVLYAGKDYESLGKVANNVLIMTYEWGYTYGPPMAVAPLNKMREVIEYAVTRIPAAKINMGIPNYGYDWSLPYINGISKAKTIGNVEAVQLAINKGVPILYDTVAQSPYFRYNENNVEHEVWFEDVRSINAKFDLIEEFGLRGVGYWQIMRLYRANWLLLRSRFL